MYLSSCTALAEAIAERRVNAVKVRERADQFIEQRYGIRDASAIVGAYFGDTDNGLPTGVLARQIASVCVEDIAFALCAQRLGCMPLNFTFVRDAFSKANHDKLHRVKIPWVSWSKAGNLVLAYERIAPANNDELEGVPLEHIRTRDGKTLPEYHRGLRLRAQVPSALGDVFALDQVLLGQAQHLPPFVYRECDGREERHAIAHTSDLHERDRPPATWYYPLYLSWFLDGSRVLFETYENPIGEVGRAKKLFDATVGEIARETGYTPLVAQIPPLSKEMLYCNRHIVEDPLACTKLAARTQEIPLGDTVPFFQSVAEAVTRYR